MQVYKQYKSIQICKKYKKLWGTEQPGLKDLKL